MALDFLPALLQWTAANPGWAYGAVFFIAFTESLALVGLFMPGAALMFGVGALVGADGLSLGPTLAWAATGAIAGDALSFWLGRRFQDRIRLLWPFRSHPEWIERSTTFFHRHGGKSVLFGRFVGPVRPVIPAVAGMLNMPAPRFFLVNIFSGLLWAPAYTLPGMVFAASLGLAAEVATRLAVLLGLLLVVLYLSLWVIRRIFDLLHPHAQAAIHALLAWSRNHALLGRLPAALLDPSHPEARGLAVLAAMLLIAGTAFALLVGQVGESSFLRSLDTYLFHRLQELRTPPADRVMVALTQLGDARVLAGLFAAVLALLLYQRRWRAVAYWSAAAGFAVAVTAVIKVTVATARPVALYDGISGFSFPSGHAVQSLAVYGFLAVLIGRDITYRLRRIIYTLSALLVVAIAFSRLYLGAHWLSDVVGGVALGLAWVALLGIAYRRHPTTPLSASRLGFVSLLALTVTAGWNSYERFETDLLRYGRQSNAVTLTEEAWWRDEWRQLSRFRGDFWGREQQPLTLQYAGDLRTLEERLQRVSWRRPPPLDAASWLRWLANDVPLAELPILPQIHAGQEQALILVATQGGRLLALRFWPTSVILEPEGKAVWVGTVSQIGVERRLGLMAVPRTLSTYPDPLEALEGALGDLAHQSVRRNESAAARGQVLLLREATSSSRRSPASPADAQAAATDRSSAAGVAW